LEGSNCEGSIDGHGGDHRGLTFVPLSLTAAMCPPPTVTMISSTPLSRACARRPRYWISLINLCKGLNCNCRQRLRPVFNPDNNFFQAAHRPETRDPKAQRNTRSEIRNPEQFALRISALGFRPSDLFHPHHSITPRLPCSTFPGATACSARKRKQFSGSSLPRMACRATADRWEASAIS